jgi:hypothetical protein
MTTSAEADDFIAEPPADVPAITAARAYKNFVAMNGQARSQRRDTQIRFGVLTDNTEGIVSNNAIEEVPELRRTPGWMISNCHDLKAAPGYHRGNGKPGRLFFIVADTPKPRSLGWFYSYIDDHGLRHNYSGGGDAQGHPRPAATGYYSAPWRLTKRSHGGHRLLLRYRQIRCYAFDHVNVDGDRPARITVILSTDAHHDCARSSAASPYAEATSPDRGFGRLLAGKTGYLRFKPQTTFKPFHMPSARSAASGDAISRSRSQREATRHPGAQ